MERWQEESRCDREEGLLPPLNLLFTATPELIKLIETTLQQDYSSPNQQEFYYSNEKTKNLTPHETPKNHEKQKAVNSQIHKITIGEWTHTQVYPDDIRAKFYFAKRRLMWEILDDVERETQVERLKRKIEFHWSDVLSYRATFNSHDETGILEIEFGKRPTFFIETNPQAGKHTQWIPVEQDFTKEQSASKYRRHTVHFFRGDLQKTLEKLYENSFWSKLAKVSFPTLPQSLYFDIGFGDSNNNVGNNLSHYGHNQTLSFDDNKNFIHHYPQGFGQFPTGNVNFNISTQFGGNDERQIMNSYVQDSHLPGTQVIQQPFSQFTNPMIHEENQTRNTRELGGNQALREIQANSMMFQMGPYLQDCLDQEGETQNMEPIPQDGNFHTNGICYCDQCLNQ